ncbi:MAG: hypothetical protein JRI23_36375 [Deltaproteobacteria bacterium]|nr:hypothetical protein [Deltaproteobacteria bacterium]
MRWIVPFLVGVLPAGCSAAATTGGHAAPDEPPAPSHRPSYGSDAGAEDDRCRAWPLASGCVRGVAASRQRMCALTSELAFCWARAGSPGAAEPPVVSHPLEVLRRLDVKRSGAKARGWGFHCEVTASSGGREVPPRVRCGGSLLWSRLRVGGGETAGIELPAGFEPKQVVAGGRHLCVLGRGGAVHCLGANDRGQLGDGSGQRSRDGETREVQGLPPAKSLAAGLDHTCAATRAGDLYCWGDTASMPPGFGGPERRVKLSTWIEAGRGSSAHQSCWLTEDRRVLCRSEQESMPAEIVAARGAVELVGRRMRACSRSEAGEVWCWMPRSAPFRVPALEPAAALVPNTPCVVLARGAVRCEGEYDFARSEQRPAFDLRGLKSPRAIGAAEGAMEDAGACAISPQGRVHCWGAIGWDWSYDDTGPVQRPSLWTPGWRTGDANAVHPIRLGSIRDAVELSRRGSCVRRGNGAVALIGYGPAPSPSRIRLTAIEAPTATNAVRLLDGNACAAVRDDGTGFAVRRPRPMAFGPAPFDPPTVIELGQVGAAVQLESESPLACLRLVDGTVRCRFQHAAGPWPPASEWLEVMPPEPAVAMQIDRTWGVCVLPAAGDIRCRPVDQQGRFGPPFEALGRATPTPRRFTVTPPPP